MPTSPQPEMINWPDEIFQTLLAYRVRQVAFVPDAGHARLLRLCGAAPSMVSLPLTSEEEGVALLAGAWLGGDRGVLLLQSSGVGNCLNMLSLTRVCRLPLLMLVTMRGEWGEFNPWQVPMGQNTASLLTLAGVIPFTVDQAERVAETVDAAARMAFAGPGATAVLLSQRLLGAKSFME